MNVEIIQVDIIIQLNQIVLTRAMPSSKSRNWSQKEDEALIQFMNKHQMDENGVKKTWNDIAVQIASIFQNNPSLQQQELEKPLKFTKTGKQCRQRWMNHLNDGLNKNSKWTCQQNKILFDSHNEFGNKWSAIASRLAGRTDNCVKNHFYSVLRRGMRKINQYIEDVKRKKTLVKTFKNQMLNKILLLSESEGKYDEKFHFKTQAKQLAYQIKQLLIKLSGEECEEELQEQNEFSPNRHFSKKSSEEIIFHLQQKGFQMITEFAKSCKKKKTKKTNHDQFDQEISVQQSMNRSNKNEHKAKKSHKKMSKNDIQNNVYIKDEQLSFQPKYHEEYEHLLRQNDNSEMNDQNFNCSPYFHDSNFHQYGSGNSDFQQKKQKRKSTKNYKEKEFIEADVESKNLLGKSNKPQIQSNEQQLGGKKGHKVKISKADSIEKPGLLEMDKDDNMNQLINIFRTSNMQNNFDNKSDDCEWFRGSGIQAQKKFSQMLGKKSLNGKNSGTDLFGNFGNSIVMKNQMQDFSPKCIDFENSANSPFPFFRKENPKFMMNESQQFFGNFRQSFTQKSPAASLQNFGVFNSQKRKQYEQRLRQFLQKSPQQQQNQANSQQINNIPNNP